MNCAATAETSSSCSCSTRLVRCGWRWAKRAWRDAEIDAADGAAEEGSGDADGEGESGAAEEANAASVGWGDKGGAVCDEDAAGS